LIELLIPNNEEEELNMAGVADNVVDSGKLMNMERIGEYCFGKDDQFPCQEGSITMVSLALAASGLALVFVIFLMHTVSDLQRASLIV
jgi:hypothetical protein